MQMLIMCIIADAFHSLNHKTVTESVGISSYSFLVYPGSN